MKAVLEFDLDNLEDVELYRRANAADDLCYAIYHIQEAFREKLNITDVERLEMIKEFAYEVDLSRIYT